MSRTDDPRARAWRALLETHAALFGRLVEEMKTDLGTPMTWYDVLLHLAEVDGQRLRMGDLAEAVLISKSGLTTLVDRMEAAGLVRREIPARNRRSTDVVLTNAGRVEFARLAEFHRAGIDRHFCAHVSAEEAEMLTAVLARLRAALNRSR